MKKRLSKSNSPRRKSQQENVSTESLEVDKNKSKQSLVDDHRIVSKGRKFSTSPNPARKQSSASNQNTTDKTKKLRKVSTVKVLNKSPGNFGSPGKRMSRKPSLKSSKTRTNQTIKSPISKPRRSPTTKEQAKKVDIIQLSPSSQKRKIDLEQKPENISDDEEIVTLKKSVTQKDEIVFKWLSGMNCPLLEKEVHDSSPPDTEKCPVLILKKPSKIGMKEKVSDNIKLSGATIRSKSPNLKMKKDPVSKINEKSSDSHLKTHKEEDDSAVGVKEVSDVEIHVSDVGKLQVIFNTRSISPEDAAIVLWIDAIPETFFTPENGRRLSFVSKTGTEEAEISFIVMKSNSADKLEDIPLPTPDIYFPPVTILRNTAVDKIGIRRLSEVVEKSVYYKRCNIGHAEWELNDI